MQERYIYLASFGFILGIVYIISNFQLLIFNKFLKSKFSNIKNSIKTVNYKLEIYQILVIAPFLLITLIYIPLTYSRNMDWKDDITLTKSVSELSPMNYLQHYNLGVRYSEVGELALAALAYEKTIKVNPSFWAAYYNLANINLAFGKKELAIEEYKEVRKLNPGYQSAKNILDNMDLIQIATDSTGIKTSAIVAKFATKSGLGFKFPAYWSVEEKSNQIILKSGSSFTVELESIQKDNYLSLEDYLNLQPKVQGTIISQGLASVPNFDSAYVVVFKDQKTDKMKLFLLKGTKVVNVLVYPVDSPLMKSFDELVLSMKLE